MSFENCKTTVVTPGQFEHNLSTDVPSESMKTSQQAEFPVLLDKQKTGAFGFENLSDCVTTTRLLVTSF